MAFNVELYDVTLIFNFNSEIAAFFLAVFGDSFQLWSPEIFQDEIRCSISLPYKTTSHLFNQKSPSQSCVSYSALDEYCFIQSPGVAGRGFYNCASSWFGLCPWHCSVLQSNIWSANKCQPSLWISVGGSSIVRTWQYAHFGDMAFLAI